MELLSKTKGVDCCPQVVIIRLKDELSEAHQKIIWWQSLGYVLSVSTLVLGALVVYLI